MDVIDELKIEFDGIYGAIREYTKKSYISNILNKLEQGIQSNSIDTMIYCVESLIDWYNDNYQSIQENEFITESNKKIHQKINSKLIKYYDELINYDNGGKETMVVDNNNRKQIFVVHGRDDLARIEVARFIEKLGLEPIILNEQANLGQTIIEKIESNSNVGFAIIIYTPCDVGNFKEYKDNLNPRARQNVIFEHGYLMAKIGRSNVCALVKDNVETPNDISGIVYITMDKYNAWQRTVANEMKARGYNIDLNKL